MSPRLGLLRTERSSSVLGSRPANLALDGDREDDADLWPFAARATTLGAILWRLPVCTSTSSPLGADEVDDFAADEGLEPIARRGEAILERGVEAVLGVKVDAGSFRDHRRGLRRAGEYDD